MSNTDSKTTQKNLRKEKRNLRKLVDKETRSKHSIQAAMRLTAMDEYKQANNIACYLCMPEEMPTTEIIKQAWKDGKSVYLPVVITLGTPLLWAKYTQSTTLSRDILDIEIPDINPNDYITADRLDFVVTPLVSFDEQLNRIGMGGGFYDRTFSFIKSNNTNNTFLAGIAFDSQRTKQITSNEWDVKPHTIITELAVYR